MDLLPVLLNPESYIVFAAGASARPLFRAFAYLLGALIFVEKIWYILRKVVDFTKYLYGKMKKEKHEYKIDFEPSDE